MVRDVLDLVGDRPHVDVLQPGQRVEQGLSFDRKPQESGRNLRLELGRQRRAEALGLERRIARRLRAERVEASCEMPVHANRLHERHRGRDRRQQLSVHGCFRGAGEAAVVASRRLSPPRLLGNGRRGVRCRPPFPSCARVSISRESPGNAERMPLSAPSNTGATRDRRPPGSPDTARGASRRSRRSGRQARARRARCRW